MNATQKAYDSIRELIVSGAVGPGAPLRESDLAAAVGVSRTPVREALRLLAASGMTQMLPNQGATVAAPNREEIEEIFALRVLLEGAVAAEAATRITADSVVHLVALQDEMETITDASRASRLASAKLNREFHLRICRALGESPLASATMTYIDYPMMLGTFFHYDAASIDRGRKHHRELIEAFRARDGAWAQAVMSCHILAARAVVRAAADTVQQPSKSARGGAKRVSARARRVC